MGQGGFIYKSSRDYHIKCGWWNLIKISTWVRFCHKNIWYSLTTFTHDNYMDYNKVCSCTFLHIVLFFTRPLPGLYSLFLDYIWEPLPTPIQWIFSNSRKFAGAYHNLHLCSRIRSQGSSSMATDWWVWLFRSLGDHLWDANRFCLG